MLHYICEKIAMCDLLVNFLFFIAGQLKKKKKKKKKKKIY